MFESGLQTLRELFSQGIFSKPYYSERVAGSNAFSSYEKFRTIPFMYKQSLRDTPVMERTNVTPEEIFGFFSSSGTTGDKTFYVYSKKDKEVHEMFVREYFRQINITSRDIGAVMAPVGTGVMAHTMHWQFTTVGASYVDCPEPTAENMLEIVKKVPVTVVATRPAIAARVAYDSETITQARESSVRILAMGGGYLSAERRKQLEYVWDAECYNLLGMSEVFGPVAAECTQKNGMHYLDRFLLIEVLDPVTKEPVPDGSPGIAVYTTLWDKGFPLLRYWSDDYIRIERTPCPCGSKLPKVYYLGRMADHINTGNSLVFPEQVENILFSYDLTGEFQVVYYEKDYSVEVESEEIADPPEGVTAALSKLLAGNVVVKLIPFGALGRGETRIHFLRR